MYCKITAPTVDLDYTRFRRFEEPNFSVGICQCTHLYLSPSLSNAAFHPSTVFFIRTTQMWFRRFSILTVTDMWAYSWSCTTSNLDSCFACCHLDCASIFCRALFRSSCNVVWRLANLQSRQGIIFSSNVHQRHNSGPFSFLLGFDWSVCQCCGRMSFIRPPSRK